MITAIYNYMLKTEIMIPPSNEGMA